MKGLDNRNEYVILVSTYSRTFQGLDLQSDIYTEELFGEVTPPGGGAFHQGEDTKFGKGGVSRR